MVRILYYTVFGCVVLLGGYFVLDGLFGRFVLWHAPPGQARTVLLLSAAAGAAVLYPAYLLGERRQRWGAGLGLVALAVITFQAVVVLGAMVLGGRP